MDSKTLQMQIEQQLEKQKFLRDQMERFKQRQLQRDTEPAESVFYKDLDVAAGQILDIISQLIQVDTFFMATNDTETNTIFKVLNKKEALVEEGSLLPYTQTYCSLVIENAQDALIIPDTTIDPLTSRMEVTKSLGSCSFIGVPIKLRSGQVFGTICALNKEKYMFTDKDVTILNSMAVFFAYVLELEQTVRDLQNATGRVS